jgi:Asp-tRNA(Asn)/Glu-tRNA(Gln) amidotransferase A subunit family amidase
VIGSILRPASYCGCVGYKPTVGGINRGGSVDYLSQSCAGVLAASLTDAWQVARTISARAGGDPGFPGISGPMTLPEARRPRALALLETAGWREATDEARAGLGELLARIRAAGVEVLDRNGDAVVAAVEAAIVPAMPLSRDINAWEFRWPLNTFARDMDRAGLSRTMQDRLAQAEAMTLEGYQELLRERTRARAVYAGLAVRCDAAITLSAPGAAPLGLESTGNPIFAVPSSFLGIPAVSLPLLAAEGLPLGVQLAGFSDADAALFAIAGWLWELAGDPIR